MKRSLFLIIVAALLFLPGESKGTPGTEFWLGWPETYYDTAELFIITGSDATVPVTVSFGPTRESTGEVRSGEPLRLPVPQGLRVSSPGVVRDHYIRVRSDDGATPIRVFFQSPETRGVPDTLAFTAHDIYAPLPARHCGGSYVIPSYENTRSGSVSFFMIVSTADGNEVRVAPSRCVAGEMVETLEKGEILYVRCPDDRGEGPPSDLTGSIVSSGKPVSIISGNRTADVPAVGTSADLLLTAPLPEELMGRRFFVPPLPRLPAYEEFADLVRIVAASEAATIRLIKETPEVILLEPGEYQDVDLSATNNRGLEVAADVPIAVYQIMKSRNFRGIGDPSLILVPPVERFATFHHIVTPDGYSEGSYVTVIAEDASSVDLDGMSIENWSQEVGSDLFYATLQVPNPASGTVEEHRVSSAAPTGVIVHGYGGYKSYGYPGDISPPPFTVLRGEEPDNLTLYDETDSSPWLDAPGSLSGGGQPLLYYRIEGVPMIHLTGERGENRVRIDF